MARYAMPKVLLLAMVTIAGVRFPMAVVPWPIKNKWRQRKISYACGIDDPHYPMPCTRDHAAWLDDCWNRVGF